MADLGPLRESRKPASGKSCPLWAKSKGSLQNTSQCRGQILVAGVSQNRGGVKESTDHYFYRFMNRAKKESKQL